VTGAHIGLAVLLVTFTGAGSGQNPKPPALGSRGLRRHGGANHFDGIPRRALETTGRVLRRFIPDQGWHLFLSLIADGGTYEFARP
jgi:hypothetical protein